MGRTEGRARRRDRSRAPVGAGSAGRATRPTSQLVRETSLDALGRIELPDAVIIDGDHNYYTVSNELRVIGERAYGPEMPLLLFHDVSWPHARRDAYYTPELIPEHERQPMVEGGGLFPEDPGTRPGALPYKWPAAREGGPRNGVLTAIEDFVAEHDRLQLVVVPAFFGFGAVWHVEASWSDAVSQLLDPWDRNPIVARLEANRVHHLAAKHVQMMEEAIAAERIARKDDIVNRLLVSKSFALARRISRFGRGGTAPFSQEELRGVLPDE